MTDRYAVLYPDGTLFVLPFSPDMEAKAFEECDDSNFNEATPIAERNVVVRIAAIEVLDRPPRPDGHCPTCGRAPA